MYKTKSKKMTKAQAKKVISSLGFSYPATKHNKERVSEAINDYMNTFRIRKNGKVTITKKGKALIKRKTQTRRKKNSGLATALKSASLS